MVWLVASCWLGLALVASGRRPLLSWLGLVLAGNGILLLGLLTLTHGPLAGLTGLGLGVGLALWRGGRVRPQLPAVAAISRADQSPTGRPSVKVSQTPSAA